MIQDISLIMFKGKKGFIAFVGKLAYFNPLVLFILTMTTAAMYFKYDSNVCFGSYKESYYDFQHTKLRALKINGSLENECNCSEDTKNARYVCKKDYKIIPMTGNLVSVLLIYELIFTILSFILSILAFRKKYNFKVTKSAEYMEDENGIEIQESVDAPSFFIQKKNE